MLTLERARELLATTTTQEHLFLHAKNVMTAMEGLALHFGEDPEHWMAIGYLHDYDYEQYPEEHLCHTQQPLLYAGLTSEEVRAILAHGYTHINDVEPQTVLEKSLFTVDELTGIIQAAARMRPAGITDMEVSSFMKKFKDKKFAAKCDREVIRQGCQMLGMEVRDVAAICIDAMKARAAELHLDPSAV
jgi:predicted hydrolase (HD superfamily)